MRNIRKLLLLAVGMMAAMAFLSSAASAQTVRLEQEAVVGNCPTNINVVAHIPQNRQCSINAESVAGTTADLYNHVPGVGEVRFSQCQNHFEAAFNRDGAGVVYDQVLVEAALCGREPCEETEVPPSANPHRNLAWPARISEVTDPPVGEERLTVTFCLHAHTDVPSEEGGGTNCTVHLHVTRQVHTYSVRTPPDVNGNGGAPCEEVPQIELEGRWTGTRAEDHPSFEVHHLNG